MSKKSLRAMNKYLKYALYGVGVYFAIWFILPLFLFIPSCDDSIKLEDVKEKYIAACEDGDYEKARKIVNKLEISKGNISNGTKRLSDAEAEEKKDEALAYINDKEIYNLLSHPSRDNDNRIMFLYDSYTRPQLPDMTDVTEVALTKGNLYLAENLLRAGVGVNSKIAQAAVNADMNNLLELIISKDPSLVLDQEVNSACRESMTYEQYKRYVRKAFDSELNKIYNTGLPGRPAIGTIDYCGMSDCKRYTKAVEEYNNQCYTLILSARDVDNLELANKVLLMMKPTLEIRDKGSDYLVTESQEQINQARKVINNM